MRQRVQDGETMARLDWSKRLLDAFAAEGISFLPYLPDGALAAAVTLADERPEFTLVPLTREEEGVGIAAGVYLAGQRAAMLIQVSGLGNSLNAIGSLAMAQRIPLLLVVTERGGLGETVSTQVPFGAAARRIVETMGISCFELRSEDEIPAVVGGAAGLAFVSRVPVVVLVSSVLLAAAA